MLTCLHLIQNIQDRLWLSQMRKRNLQEWHAEGDPGIFVEMLELGPGLPISWFILSSKNLEQKWNITIMPSPSCHPVCALPIFLDRKEQADL